MGVERIVWYDPEIKLGDKLFERLREDRKKYGDSGAVLDVFLEMFNLNNFPCSWKCLT